MKSSSVLVTICCMFLVEELYNKMKKRYQENQTIEDLIQQIKETYPYGNVRNYRTVRNRLIRLSKDYFSDDINTAIHQLIQSHDGDTRILMITEVAEKEYGLNNNLDLDDLKKEISLIIFGTC